MRIPMMGLGLGFGCPFLLLGGFPAGVYRENHVTWQELGGHDKQSAGADSLPSQQPSATAGFPAGCHESQNVTHQKRKQHDGGVCIQFAALFKPGFNWGAFSMPWCDGVRRAGLTCALKHRPFLPNVAIIRLRIFRSIREILLVTCLKNVRQIKRGFNSDAKSTQQSFERAAQRETFWHRGDQSSRSLIGFGQPLYQEWMA